MKLLDYIKDKFYFVIISLVSYFFIFLILLAFKVEINLALLIIIILLLTQSVLLLYDYIRKQKFYKDLISNIKRLDKSYLVLETIDKPEFYEGAILYHALYDINKSMNENVKANELQLNEFKDYIEMWIHEVKKPIASLVLLLSNKNSLLDRKVKNILNQLTLTIDQVLYYVRSEYAEKDYYIKEIDLESVIKNVGIKNMDDLLINKIDFIVNIENIKVYTDSKWLEFILNQIINNSIKYKRNISNSYIKIYSTKDNKNTKLIIEDNGMGIHLSDIKRVFDKTFTGINGRRKNSSTGMGLYIAKNLCDKLGHKIVISSKVNSYTKVIITFSNNNYYSVIK